MKILVLSNKAPFPSNDGSSIAIANLALGFADNGIDLHLLTINTKKHFKADEKIDAFIKEKTHYQSVYKILGKTSIQYGSCHWASITGFCRFDYH